MKLVLTDIYESHFEIYDHLGGIDRGDKARPLASVALHECESIADGSDLYQVVNTYFDKDVLKHTGLKLHEFLNYPREFIALLFKQIDKIDLKESRKTQEVTNLINAGVQKK